MMRYNAEHELHLLLLLLGCAFPYCRAWNETLLSATTCVLHVLLFRTFVLPLGINDMLAATKCRSLYQFGDEIIATWRADSVAEQRDSQVLLFCSLDDTLRVGGYYVQGCAPITDQGHIHSLRGAPTNCFICDC